MSKKDPTFKRLSIILVLFVIVLLISVAQTVFLRDSEGYDQLTGEMKEIGVFDVVMDIIGFFIGGFLLKIVLLPAYMIVFILPVYLLLLISFWYLVLDFIKDIEVLGSSV